MFNLEQSIADWRWRMLDAGIKAPVPLAELEIHLREEIEQQMKSGSDAQRAFEIAVREMGQGDLLRSEFRKGKRKFMTRTLMVWLGILGVMFGAALILPALAWYNNHGTMPAAHLEAFLLGVVIALGGLGSAIFGFKKPRKA